MNETSLWCRYHRCLHPFSDAFNYHNWLIGLALKSLEDGFMPETVSLPHTEPLCCTYPTHVSTIAESCYFSLSASTQNRSIVWCNKPRVQCAKGFREMVGRSFDRFHEVGFLRFLGFRAKKNNEQECMRKGKQLLLS